MYLADEVRTGLMDQPITVSVVAVVLSLLLYTTRQSLDVKHIPSIGRFKSGGLLSYVDALKFIFGSTKHITNGMAKTRAQIVRIPALFGWTIVVRGREMLEELKQLPDDVVSTGAAVEELLQFRYTFGEAMATNPYHIPIVKTRMIRSLPQMTPGVHEEIVAAFQEYINPSTSEWKSYVANDVLLKVVARASNRVLVGLPLCRNPDFIDIAINYTMEVLKTSGILRMSPEFLRPIIAPLLPTNRTSKPRAEKHIVPLVRHREEQLSLLGAEYEPPNDMLSWLMEAAEGEEKSAESLTGRILLVNFGEIHTSTVSTLQTLYDFAAYTQYQDILREEVRAVVKEHGWTKPAVDRMVRLDSFVKESLRIRPMGTVTMRRHVVQDVVFSNAVKVPQGTVIGADLLGMHHDPAVYENPHEFNPWRYSDAYESTGRKSDITVASPDFLLFGYGRHACPGRFFAATEIKLMMAYIVLNYDVKTENGDRPRDRSFAGYDWPDPKVKLLFRGREDSGVV